MRDEKPEAARAQFSARREEERPTIVGGRPPEKPPRPGSFSQGIEKVILLAALDGEFRAKLLTDRTAALDSCEVELTVNERAILSAIPPAQLESVIDNAEVPKSAKKAFLRGVAAAVILGSVLGAASCSDDYNSTRGIQPERKSIEKIQRK